MPGMQASLQRNQRRAKGAAQTSLLNCTKMCRFFEQGACERGKRCTFAHAAVELKPVPDLHCTKLCAKGTDCLDPGCRFAHRQAEIRVMATAKPTLHLAELCRVPAKTPGTAMALADKVSKPRRLRKAANSPTSSETSTRASDKFSSNSTLSLCDFPEICDDAKVHETNAPSSGVTWEPDTAAIEPMIVAQEPEKLSLEEFATIWTSAMVVNTLLEFRPEKRGLRRVKSAPLL